MAKMSILPSIVAGFCWCILKLLDASWGHLGAILGPSWGHLWAILGPSQGHPGAIWGPSWPSWTFLEAVLGIPGALAAAIEMTNDILRKSASRPDEVSFLQCMTTSRSKVGEQVGFEIDPRGPELAPDGQKVRR